MKYKINKRFVIIFVLFTFLLPGKLIFAQTSDNAALLYYQAFMLYEDSNEDIRTKIHDVAMSGLEPDEQVELYIKEQQYLINTIVSAANIENCDWGIDYSVGIKLKLSHIYNIRPVAWLVINDAKILAKHGQYEMALQRCLTLHKMARHVAKGQLISLLVSCSLAGMANNCIGDILSEMPQDVEILERLKTELAKINKEPFRLNEGIKLEYIGAAPELTIERIQTFIDVMREPMVSSLASPDYTPRSLTEDEEKQREKQREEQRKIDEIFDERLSNINEAFIEGNKQYFKKLYLEEVPAALELNYEQAYKKLTELSQRTKKDLIENPNATIASLIDTPFSVVYSKVTVNNSFTNALLNAIDIYILKAKTGQLPDQLPKGLPKDLLIDGDFKYQKTEDGFLISTQGKELPKEQIHEYMYKVKK